MPSTSETGHAKNVANFQDLVAFVIGYGATYNPSKAALKLAQLNTLANGADTNLADIVTKNTAYNSFVNNRMIAFDGLKAFSTRLLNALEATDATKEKIGDAKTFNRKIQGKRAGNTAAAPTDPNTPTPTNTTLCRVCLSPTIRGKLCTQRNRFKNCCTHSKTSRLSSKKQCCCHSIHHSK